MIDAVRVALGAVRSRGLPAPGDTALVELDGCPRTYVGVDHELRAHLLVPIATDSSPSLASDLVTLDIAARSLVLGGNVGSYLDVTCMFQSVADVFEHFAAAVAEELRKGTKGPDALGYVLEKWRQFLIGGAAPPGRAKIASLFGELLVLRDLLRVDPNGAVGLWVGPYGGRHDFRNASAAIEVKTTVSHTSREVTVHGEDQLSAPEGGSLHLHLVRLEEAPQGGASLPTLVDDLLATGAAAEPLFEALGAAGIPAVELANVKDVAFEVRERLTVIVDDDMPRIVPSSFLTGARPLGVADITYKIDLDHVFESALDEDGYAALLSSVVRDSA